MSEPYDYVYNDDDAPSAGDIAEAIEQAVQERVGQHAFATQAQASEFSLLAAEQALREDYTDYDELRPQIAEHLQAAGYGEGSFFTPRDAYNALESILLRVAAQENEKRQWDPKAAWDEVKAAYTPNPWTS